MAPTTTSANNAGTEFEDSIIGEGSGGQGAVARQRRSPSADLTVEYDVFACDAFTEDRGRWLRLMPDADFGYGEPRDFPQVAREVRSIIAIVDPNSDTESVSLCEVIEPSEE